MSDHGKYILFLFSALINFTLSAEGIGGTVDRTKVSATGAASYSVPLFVPPGRAGMQPKLSIVYSSQGGDGLLGKGWNIAGLSSITRTGQDFYNDGKVTPVQLTNEDRFMLDGKRLIAVFGSNGANGTKYRTEMESYVSVTSSGPSVGTTSPSTFTVQTRDGSTIEYGGVVQSGTQVSVAVMYAGTPATPVTWMISKITDAQGNYMTYSYSQGAPGSNVYYIKEIRYTKNDNFSNNPDNQVSFIYEVADRPDKQLGFVFGTKFTFSKRLAEVRMLANGTIAHSYKFEYQATHYNSKLKSIQESGTNFESYPKINVEWIGGNTSYMPFEQGLDDPKADSTFVLNGDFNGDGKMDRLNVYYKSSINSPFTEYLGNGDGTYAYTGVTLSGYNLSDPSKRYYSYDHAHIAQPELSDLNGDGLQDILLPVATTNEFGVPVDAVVPYFSKRTGGFQAGSPLIWNHSSVYDPLASRNFKYCTGDFDGDGLSDVFVFVNYNWTILSITKGEIAHQGLGVENNAIFNAIDVDGDGKNEIMLYAGGNATHIIQFSGHAGYEFSTVNGYPFPGDFNGDGKTDLLLYNTLSGNGVWQLAFSNGIQGANLNPYADVHPLTIGNNGSPDPDDTVNTSTHHYFVADFNGDGKSDIIDWSDGTNVSTHKVSATVYWMQGDEFPQEDNSISFGNVDYIPSSIADVDGDGHMDIIFDQKHVISFKDQFDKVGKITGSLGNSTAFTYKPLSNCSCYQKGSDAVFPLADIDVPLYVVESAIVDEGNGSSHLMEYNYKGATEHLQGKGFVGFTSMERRDRGTFLSQTETFDNSAEGFYSNALAGSSTKSLHTGELMAASTYTYTHSASTAAGVHRLYPSTVLTRDFLKKTYVLTEMNMDPDGNLTSRKTTYQRDDPASQGNKLTDLKVTETYTFQKPLAFAFTSVPWTGSVVSQRGSDVFSKSFELTVNGKGQVVLKNEDSGHLLTDYNYDVATSNLVGSTVHGAGITAPRTVTYTYDDRAQFVKTSSRKDQQVVTTTFDNIYGNVLTSQDINGHTTTYTYDAFGHLATAQTDALPKATITRSWSGPGKYKVQTSQPGKPSSAEYFDALNREVRSQVQHFDGSFVNVDRSYNSAGMLTSVSEPFREGGAATMFTNYLLDNFLRLSALTLPTGEVVSYTYDDNIVNTTSTSGETTGRAYDATGALLISNDNAGFVSYTYKACGKPATINTPPHVIPVKMTYDNFGMQTSLTDPNAGTSKYTYNALGELLTQVDNTNDVTHTFSFAYDELGRPTTDGINTYKYDDKPNAKGKLIEIDKGSTKEFFDYDAQSRLRGDLVSFESKDYKTEYTYNALDQLESTAYPNNMFKMYNSYTPSGYLQAITNGTSNAVWACNEMNVRGQVTQCQNGNGIIQQRSYTDLGYLKDIKGFGTSELPLHYTYDFDPVTGNLKSRTETHVLNGVIQYSNSESFGYDGMNRLQGAQSAAGNLTMAYDVSGNITWKSDICNSGYTYKEAPFPPHQVSTVQNPVVGFPSASQVISYTAFNKAEHIAEGLNSVDLSYGPGQQRMKMDFNAEVLVLNIPVKVNKGSRFYFGNYEKNVDVTGRQREIIYVPTPIGISAMLVRNTDANNTATDSIYYVYTDHLGSITGITDGLNKLMDIRSYDAWGRQRNANNWTYKDNKLNYGVGVLTDRGYTGHEHLNQFNLINMNGRVYDPLVGAMIQPDNYVGDYTSSQAYNRYVYCNNNPLKYIDPSGDATHYVFSSTPNDYSDYGEMGEKHGLEGDKFQHYSLTMANSGLYDSSPVDFASSLGVGGTSQGSETQPGTVEEGVYVSSSSANNSSSMFNGFALGGTPASEGGGSSVGAGLGGIQNSRGAEGDINLGGRNFFGDNYTGPNNPVGYSLPPKNRRDAISMRHDQSYDTFGAIGAKGVFTNGYVIPIDILFAVDQYKLGLNQLFNGLTAPMGTGGYDVQQGIYSISAGTFIGGAALFKITFINPYKPF